MSDEPAPGQIVILNGTPRAGKSSIVSVIQDTFDGVWMNLGVDVFARGVTPKRYQPGIGLRPGRGPGPGGDNPAIQALLPAMYAALFWSIAAHSRLGLNVVFEGGLHGAHYTGRGHLGRIAAAPAFRRDARQKTGGPADLGDVHG